MKNKQPVWKPGNKDESSCEFFDRQHGIVDSSVFEEIPEPTPDLTGRRFISTNAIASSNGLPVILTCDRIVDQMHLHSTVGGSHAPWTCRVEKDFTRWA